MVAYLALLMGFALVIWLMRQDMMARATRSPALFIPGLWVFVQATHPLSYWLNPKDGGGETLFDFLVPFGLMVSALLVVQRRGLKWGKLAIQNFALFQIYGYFALSALWSDEPVLSIKRIIKDFGLIPMALVLMTERNPGEAVRLLFARVSYIVFTFSIITIKWFPEIGRQARNSGDSMFRGITLHKNTLGLIVFICSILLLWDLLEISKWQGKAKEKMRQMNIRVGMLLMGSWLLATSGSKTALLCLVLGVLVFWITGRVVRMRNGKRVLVGGLALAIALATVDKTLGVSDMIIRALGKDPSLTGRTEIWEHVVKQVTDPWFGCGFYVFWDSARGKLALEAIGAAIKSAHNGYLEVYVDGGGIGLGLLGLFLLASGRRVINDIFRGSQLARIGLAFWTIAIIYNFSETSFFRLDALWFILILTTLGATRLAGRWAVESSEAGAYGSAKQQGAFSQKTTTI